jgi:GT2 family glycosyltransferase
MDMIDGKVPVNTDMSFVAYQQEGVRLYKEGSFVMAFRCLQAAFNLEPDHAELRELLGRVALRLQAPDLAVSLVECFADRSSFSLATLAEAHLLMKDFNKSRAALDRLGKLPAYSDFCNDIRISLSLHSGDFETGLADTADLCERYPWNTEKRLQFSAWFDKFSKIEDSARFSDFVAALGLEPFFEARQESPQQNSIRSVDIIIPVFNALDDLQKCLQSLQRWPEPAIDRIILVDDCSDAETQLWLSTYAATHTEVTLLRNAENLGFTRSVLRGIGASMADAFVMLNSDTVLTAGWCRGLVNALESDDRNALAGPVSNNAYFQSVIPAGQAEAADRAAGLVAAVSRNIRPRVPLLSGFCLLVRRAAYNEVGGLDAEAFPRGYYEVQDLALRLLDLGYFACLADDVYVEHAAGGSIKSERKRALLEQGFLTLADRIGIVRLLAAEAMCANNPEIAYLRKALAHNVGQRCRAETEGQETPSAAFAIRKAPLTDARGAEVCLFVTHAPLGVPLEYTTDYINALKEQGIKILACLITDDLDFPLSASWAALADTIMVRSNAGYDFGAWADMLRTFPDLWQASRLYFVNDSLIGPFGSLEGIIAEIRARDAGFFAFSECTSGGYHAQSFFFGWNGRNLASEGLRSFWAEVRNLSSKFDVIDSYEHGIAGLSAALPDASKQIVFGMERVFSRRAEAMSRFNPTHNGWRALLEAGFPFVKTDLLRDGVPFIDTDGWQAELTAKGIDVGRVQRHIQRSRINRL